MTSFVNKMSEQAMVPRHIALVIVKVFFFVWILFTLILVLVLIPDITHVDRYRLCFQTGDVQQIHCGSDKFQSHLQTRLSQNYEELLEKETNEVISTSSVEAVLDEMMVKESIDIKPAARYIGRSMTNEERTVAEKFSTEGPLKHVPSWHINEVSLELRKGFERYGVSLKNGWITVPVSGFYHVYSVTDFNEDFAEGSPPEGFDLMPVMHVIFQYNVKEGVKKIVASEQPHMYPPRRRSFNMYSSFVNAFLNLKAGDQVGVKVSNLTMLREPDFSCFGLHKYK